MFENCKESVGQGPAEKTKKSTFSDLCFISRTVVGGYQTKTCFLRVTLYLMFRKRGNVKIYFFQKHSASEANVSRARERGEAFKGLLFAVASLTDNTNF